MTNTPFQQLIATHSLSIQEAHRFMAWVSGGKSTMSVHYRSLEVLNEYFEVWDEEGRP